MNSGAASLQAALGDTYAVNDNVNDNAGGGKALVAITVLVARLTPLITAVAGLGVLNTVALQTREKAHDHVGVPLPHRGRPPHRVKPRPATGKRTRTSRTTARKAFAARFPLPQGLSSAAGNAPW